MLVGTAAALALAAPAAAIPTSPVYDSKGNLIETPFVPQEEAAARLESEEAIRAARRFPKIAGWLERYSGRKLTEEATFDSGDRAWTVKVWAPGEAGQIVLAKVDDASARVTEAWTGPQVAWKMARGYEGAFGRAVNAPYVWLPLCLLFLLPFFDWRRPLRLLHLDLLVLLGFGLSHFFFNRGEISASVPLAYPVLLYLLGRMLLAGLRPRGRRERLVPHARASWLALGLVFLVGFRVALNVVDSNVIDVGYAGVIGADRIVDGDELYGGGFPEGNRQGDTYGPVNYLAYVPFEQALPWSGGWDELPAAHAAAIAFDLLTLLGLLLLGRRLRPGLEGRKLGLALAFAWASFPYTLFALASNANDSLVAMLLVYALLAASSPLGRGALVGLAAATKFAPLALVPLFARGASPWRGRRAVGVFALALTAVLALALLPFLPDGGLRELYDRTIGYQAGRETPFSLWGQAPSLEWLRVAVLAGAAGLGLLVGFLPRRRSVPQLAALGAAVLIALQLAATYWFYLYIVWFTPLVLVAFFAPYRDPRTPAQPPPRRAAEMAAPAPEPALA